MYRRILLKLSGEVLAGDEKLGINPEVVHSLCMQIKEIHNENVQIGVVVGAGNIWRGRYAPQMDRVSRDQMGMIATVINAIALKDELEKIGVSSVVQTALEMPKVAELYKTDKAKKYLEEGKVVIFAGGTGNPYFSTDTAAALRAAEIEADIILVGKTIDGVYSADPKIDKNAVKYDNITYIDILTQKLKVMDLPAISLCMENSIPLSVFSIYENENILKAANGENIGTIVK